MAVSEYQIILYNRSGVKQGHIVDFRELYYVKRRNSVGVCQFELDVDHPAVSLIQDRWYVGIMRRNTDFGLDWTEDYYGIIRSVEKRMDAERTRVVIRAFSLLHMLEWRVIAYYADMEGKSVFTSCPAERIMKDLVRYNCTASATTANLRRRSGSEMGASIEIQSGCTGGSSITWSGPWEQLLPNLQQISDTGGGDFDLIKTDGSVFEFRYYAGQRGTDRSASVVFAPTYDNMADISYIKDRSEERTICLVAGRGTSSCRAVLVASGPDYSASADYEMVFNATAGCGMYYLQSEGNKKTRERRAKAELTFSPLQTSQTFYGVHYTMGDKVKVVYEDTTACYIVEAVTVRVHQDGGDGIEVELKEWPTR